MQEQLRVSVAYLVPMARDLCWPQAKRWKHLSIFVPT